MNIYEIKQKLESYEKAIFKLNEISRIIGMSKEKTNIYLNRMLNKDLLFKVERNKYATTKDIFVIASQLITPSYLGLSSSLYLQGYFSQTIDKLLVITSIQKKNINVLDTEIIFIKTKPSFVFGYKKVKKENSVIFVSDLEKTIIDSLLFTKHISGVDFLDLIKNADHEKLINYTKEIDKEVLTRRIGYLLDAAGVEHDLERETKTIYQFDPKQEKRQLNKKWLLYAK